MKSLLSELSKGKITFESIDYKRRNVLINLLTICALVALFFFGVVLFFSEKYVFATVDIFMFVVILILHVNAIKKEDFRVSLQLELVLIGILFIYMTLYSPVNTGAWAWASIYPLIVMFTLGKRGIWYASTFLVCSLITFAIRGTPLIAQEAYRGELISRFLFMYGLNFSVAFLIEKIWLESLRILKKLHLQLKETNQELEVAKREVEELSLHDPLTGLYNRRYFDAILKNISFISARELSSLGIMMIDIDHFKKINDTFGHSVGDKALVAISSTIQKVIRRKADLLFRYGGEEFVLILYSPSKEQMNILANDIRYEVNKPYLIPEQEKITLSIGGALWRPELPETIQEYVEIADKAMYQSKETGRDRYQFAENGFEEELKTVKG